MTIPAATYRIQFRNGMTFDRAASLAPYLQQLGISHLYASPVFTATQGSTHGYDVTDANEIDPAIGGRAGFDRMVQALQRAGLGLILDIVPNHMAASLENAWWRDVIEQGQDSRYARYFDIDWSRRLTLPFLGDDFATALDNGEISVKRDPQSGKPALAYFDSFYPLNPSSWQGRENEVLSLRNKADIAALHAQQSWRLMCWRDAPHDLSYRRFFEITGLAGVRVEDPEVFDDSHRLILELVHSGVVDGLRIDHVDGLADPKAYLERLRQHTGPDCYITVEKILGAGEQLAADWPVSGTTGYEFITSLSEVFIDGEQISALREAYNDVQDKTVDMAVELRDAKLLMVDKNFAGEFATLLKLVVTAAQHDSPHLSEASLHQALRELLVAFPVYRTYGTAQGLPASDLALLQTVAEKVRTSVNAPDPAALSFISDMLTGQVSAQSAFTADNFRSRFQQLTGPLMAKSVEDTLFFRQNMALALNEVGADPLPHAFSPERFHGDMQSRLEQQPDGISSTSTHDTKRGEDARARLYTLSEAPDVWAESVTRWRQMNKAHVSVIKDGPAPKPAGEWMFYQALAGVWPPALQPEDTAGLQALEERFQAWVEKALREAKLRTSWDETNDRYEQAMLDYAHHLLSAGSHTFLQDFCHTLQPFIRAGMVNSLTQTIIKLTAPGVPDIYQGSEGWNFSLVDPDNRRAPDFAALERLLDAPKKADFSSLQDWLSGQVKQHTIATLLPLRQQYPELFRTGDYLPLTATGPRAKNVLAFARAQQDRLLIVVTPRLVLHGLDAHFAAKQSESWAETEIILPARLAVRDYRNIFTGEKQFLYERFTLESAGYCAPLILLSE